MSSEQSGINTYMIIAMATIVVGFGGSVFVYRLSGVEE